MGNKSSGQRRRLKNRVKIMEHIRTVPIGSRDLVIVELLEKRKLLTFLLTSHYDANKFSNIIIKDEGKTRKPLEFLEAVGEKIQEEGDI